jgi:arylsulfatase A-like enzyme
MLTPTTDDRRPTTDDRRPTTEQSIDGGWKKSRGRRLTEYERAALVPGGWGAGMAEWENTMDLSAPSTAQAGRQPNIVFVLTDDQGYGDLGCHGNPYIRTPHLDRLHAESVRLTDYHVGPTCAPTRAGLLTGHYANSTGVWHTIGGRSLLRQNERTIAGILSDAGYATGLFGKWHLGDAAPYRPQDRGFQEVITHGGGGIGNTPDFWGNNYADDHYCHNGTWEPFAGYCTDVWFGEAIRFVERNRDRPFFCYITPNAPHSPHIVPERFVEPYRELVASDPQAAAFFGSAGSDQMLKFYGMVTCIDENVGRLRTRLGELGLARNTIFIFMTDNGSAGGLMLDRTGFVSHGYGAGMRGKKGSPYEGGHRVPFFLHWPEGGFDTGRDVTPLAANVDILPTLLELCSVDDPAVAGVHGRSLVPLLRGDADDWPDRTMVTDSQRLVQPVKWRLSCAMRGQWRLVNGRYLFNLAADPEQREDIAEAHPEVVEHLRAGYEAWWTTVSQQFDEEIPIPIGGHGPTQLTAHDWRTVPDRQFGPEEAGDNTRCVWNQAQVRQGPEHTGYWEIDIVRSGTYRFELRRWPREADLPARAGIEGEIKPYTDAIESGYGGGRALPIEQAGIRVAGREAVKEVEPTDTAVVFELPLEAGPAHLETFLANDQGLHLGAYYVYVERHG